MTKRIVVTGANRGLGLALARVFSNRGDAVWGGCRVPEEAQALAALPSARALSLDVSDPASIDAFAADLAEQTDGVDVLVNNAGVNGTAVGAATDACGVLQIAPEVFEAQMRVNAVGPMLVTRALRPLLEAAPAAKVVNVSSQLGAMELGTRALSDVGYNASKAALNMITRALAGTLGPKGVTVIAVHPGWVSTDMGGSKAPLTPEESARALVATIDRLETDENGAFLRWDGQPHPW